MSKHRRINSDEIAAMMKALSNPSRLEIFTRLVANCCSRVECDAGDGGQSCVGRLGSGLGIGPSTVSHHIKELRSAGLIRVERQGQKIYCSVDMGSLEALAGFLSGLTGAGRGGSPAGGECCKTGRKGRPTDNRKGSTE